MSIAIGPFRHYTTAKLYRVQKSFFFSYPTCSREIIITRLFNKKTLIGVSQVDVIVNSTSSELDLSRNASSKALSDAAGPTLQQECKAIGKVNIGDTVITSGAKLKCKHVLHTSCAQWNQQSGEQVRNKISNSLKSQIPQMFPSQLW